MDTVRLGSPTKTRLGQCWRATSATEYQAAPLGGHLDSLKTHFNVDLYVVWRIQVVAHSPFPFGISPSKSIASTTSLSVARQTSVQNPLLPKMGVPWNNTVIISKCALDAWLGSNFQCVNDSYRIPPSLDLDLLSHGDLPHP